MNPSKKTGPAEKRSVRANMQPAKKPSEMDRTPKLRVPEDKREIKQAFEGGASVNSKAAVLNAPKTVRFDDKPKDVPSPQQRITNVAKTFDSKEKPAGMERNAFASVFRQSSNFPEEWLDHHREQCARATKPLHSHAMKAVQAAGGLGATGWGQAGELAEDSKKRLNATAMAAWRLLIPPPAKGAAGKKAQKAAGRAAFDNLPKELKNSIAEFGKGLAMSENFHRAHPESQANLLRNFAVFAFFEGLYPAVGLEGTEKHRYEALTKLPDGKARPEKTLSQQEKSELAALREKKFYLAKIAKAGTSLCGMEKKYTAQDFTWSAGDKTRGAAFFSAWEAHLIKSSGWTAPSVLHLEPDQRSKDLRRNSRSDLKGEPSVHPAPKVQVKVFASKGQEASDKLDDVSELVKKLGIDSDQGHVKAMIHNFDHYIREAVYQPGGLKAGVALDGQTRWEIEKRPDGTLAAHYSIAQSQGAPAFNTTVTLARPSPAVGSSASSLSSAAVSGTIVFPNPTDLDDWEVQPPLIHVAPENRWPASQSETD